MALSETEMKAISKARGCCAHDRDEATITLAFDTEEDAREAFKAVLPAHRIRVMDDNK